MSSSVTPSLFTPLKIGQHILNHRIVLAPMTRARSDANGLVSDIDIEHFQQRATQGGLLISGANAISVNAGGFPNCPGIFTKEQIGAWKKVTSAVHDKGGIIFLQIVHAGRATFSFCLPDGQHAVSASDIAIEGISAFGFPYEKPRALTVDGIKSITQEFAQAALNAVEAGFDGVEIHAAAGFLLDQFIHTSSNKRTDEYGGSIENRTRFALEVVGAISETIGQDKTAIRLSPWADFQDMKDEDPLATYSYLTSALEKKYPHLAYLHFTEDRVSVHVDGPVHQSEGRSLAPFRALWSGPFISDGNYTYSIDAAYDYAEQSPNGLVAFGRAFIANPDLVERIRHHWKLNPYDRSTFYTPGPAGYIDYPFYNQV
ncbi:hypothetical protein BC941DRAFT_500268 [Chlamydoabsidia padenii]|nr:hypothetical protein BC941DRAFT_500268 [Chlamydoabsidia padenii]